MAPVACVSWDASPTPCSGTLPAPFMAEPMAAARLAPIASVIATLKRQKAFSLDKTHANKLVAPLVLRLDAGDQELQKLLSKFGWSGSEGFVRSLDLRGLQAALQKYQYVKVAVIGRGAYGAVHKVVNRETHELQAIKQVRMTERGLCEATLREISTLRELNHCNIVKLVEVIAAVPSRYCYLVLELQDTDLYSYLVKRPGLPDIRTVKSIMYQVLAGLHHAHCHSIMHRDLKPHNILLGGLKAAPPPAHPPPSAALLGNPSTGPVAPWPAAPAGFSAAGGAASISGSGGGGARVQVKIADFGLARPYLPGCNGDAGGTAGDAVYTDWVVTLLYRAPELLLGARHYGPAIDIWSAGCVLAELLAGSPLFSADCNCQIGLLFDMFQKLGTPRPEQWEELPRLEHFSDQFPVWRPMQLEKLVPRLASDPLGADLLARMLLYDPRRRITASQALQHPWFDEVRLQETHAAAAAAAAAAEAEAAKVTACKY